MGSYFDHAARRMASRMSRRDAIGMIGVGFGSLLLPFLGGKSAQAAQPTNPPPTPGPSCKEFEEFFCPNLVNPTCCKNGVHCGLLGCGSPI